VTGVTQLDLQSFAILAGRKSVSGFSKIREIPPDLFAKISSVSGTPSGAAFASAL
jgi:hypothetical protein